MIRGSVDVVNKKRATGWVYSDDKRIPLAVEAVINGQVVGKATADVLRPDLAQAGIGDGKCGFEIRFSDEIDSLYLPFVQVMLEGTDLELRRWAGAGFRDYFRALYQRYPRSGRSASVFGGLWTDRTDASAVLKGRSDIGLLGASDANCLARFINDGAVPMPLNAGKLNGSPSKSSKLPEVVSKVLFDETILRTLRHILDDNPVAVRADRLDADEVGFAQMSALEDLPSPAESLGLIFPVSDKAATVDMVRGGHRLPEFLPDGLSRWTFAAAERTSLASLSPELPVDRHLVPPGHALLVGPGALHRIRGAAAHAVRVLVLPSRLSVIRFHQEPPTGELTHESGARVWV